MQKKGVLQLLLAAAQWVSHVWARSSYGDLPRPHSQNGQALGDLAASAWPGENHPEARLIRKPLCQTPPAHSGTLQTPKYALLAA